MLLLRRVGRGIDGGRWMSCALGCWTVGVAFGRLFGLSKEFMLFVPKTYEVYQALDRTPTCLNSWQVTEMSHSACRGTPGMMYEWRS